MTVVQLYLFRTDSDHVQGREAKTHTLSSSTSPYRPSKGVPPPPRNLFHYLLVVLPLYTRFVDFFLILFYFSFAQETTHLELKQTSMLSAIASLTPFSDFNQSPRNMYQCQVKQQLVTEACFKRCAIIISNSFETKDNSFRRRLLIQLSSTQQ